MSKKEFTHVSSEGKPQMVNVAEKAITVRTAKARAIINPGPEILALLKGDEIITKKGLAHIVNGQRSRTCRG